MAARGEEPADARSRSDFYRRRAALIYIAAEQARSALRERDRAAHMSMEWVEAMAELKRIAEIFARYAPDPERAHHAQAPTGPTWSSVQEKRGGNAVANCSKRDTVSALTRRHGWRDALFSCSTPTYRDAVAVSICTGARPAEIAQGVTVLQHAEGIISITIKGAKIGPSRGQPERTVLVRVDCDAARHLASLAEGGTATVSTNAKRLSDAVADTAKRAFPGLRARITPYSLRHVAASALKAAGVDDVALAETLGHRATRSQQAYGRACHARRDATSIVGVSASMPVRATRRNPALAVRPAPTSPRPT
jgi:integrase